MLKSFLVAPGCRPQKGGGASRARDMTSEMDQRLRERVQRLLAPGQSSARLSAKDPGEQSPRKATKKSVDSKEPVDFEAQVTAELIHNDFAKKPLNPSKVREQFRKQREEEAFHREAEAFLRCPPTMKIADQVKVRAAMDEQSSTRTTSRPGLPVPMWEQSILNSLPYGRFAECCEKGAPHLSARRTGPGKHMVDESDGISAAGKTKTRAGGLNQLGLLLGVVAREGESAVHKKVHGASSGAPCQDHYSFERGLEVIDKEFPLGKRAFPAATQRDFPLIA